MSDVVQVLEKDAIALGEAIASAATSGTGSATLQPAQAQVAGKTLDVTLSVSISKGSAPAKSGDLLASGLRLGEAFAQAVLQGSSSATFDPFGVNVAGTELVITASVSVSVR